MYYVLQNSETDTDMAVPMNTLGAVLNYAKTRRTRRMRVMTTDTFETVAVFDRDDDGELLLLVGTLEALYAATERGIRVDPGAGWPDDPR